MSDDKKPEKPARHVPPSLASDKRPAAIPVKLAILTKNMNIPGDSAADKIKCNPEKRGNYYTVDYIPAMRHHEVTYYPADEKQPVERGYIHESMVGRWDPA